MTVMRCLKGESTRSAKLVRIVTFEAKPTVIISHGRLTSEYATLNRVVRMKTLSYSLTMDLRY